MVAALATASPSPAQTDIIDHSKWRVFMATATWSIGQARARTPIGT